MVWPPSERPLVTSGSAVTPPALPLVIVVTPAPSRRSQVSIVNVLLRRAVPVPSVTWSLVPSKSSAEPEPGPPDGVAVT